MDSLKHFKEIISYEPNPANLFLGEMGGSTSTVVNQGTGRKTWTTRAFQRRPDLSGEPPSQVSSSSDQK